MAVAVWPSEGLPAPSPELTGGTHGRPAATRPVLAVRTRPGPCGVAAAGDAAVRPAGDGEAPDPVIRGAPARRSRPGLPAAAARVRRRAAARVHGRRPGLRGGGGAGFVRPAGCRPAGGLAVAGAGAGAARLGARQGLRGL